MLKLRKILCTTLAAIALFTGSAFTYGVNNDKGTVSPFVSIEANAASETWGDYAEFKTTSWEPVRSAPNNSAPLVGSYGANKQVWGRRVYINGKATKYVAVAYWNGWNSVLGYVKAVKA